MMIKWEKKIHRGYAEWEKSLKGRTDLPVGLKHMVEKSFFAKYRWIGGQYSIIRINRALSSPVDCWKEHKHVECDCSRNKVWETYDGSDTRTFKTLKEAKAYCETLNENKTWKK